MLVSHDKFHSSNGKRLILIVDDEMINREMLSAALEDEYEVLTAADGLEALALTREHAGQLSLILLDIMMPGMSGTELLKVLKAEKELSYIPVIVLTADQNMEIECLSLGASDFIPKPYPQRDIILARIRRTIELSEDRQIIQVTERDDLTGLYNREYFYRYADQFDQHHKGMDMDAVVIDVNHFHLLNERYGKEYGDQVLRRIGQMVRGMVQESGGIVSRKEADTFLVYCPHREDYDLILEEASRGLAEEDYSTGRVRLRMGIYETVDKGIDIERRFDRAKMAADTVRDNYQQSIALYDAGMHESELYAEQISEDFQKAVEEHQFQVYYQPKFDVRGEIPGLTSAEALVRWEHPKLGLVSPGAFIPVFESNGMIRTLDRYVWRESARQIRAWKDSYGISVPVSVNISRVDMFDPDLIQYLSGLLAEFGLEPEELFLEITESAYTSDSELIITRVRELRQLGFKIEMDDFGTGYSSLGMLSHLPIDILKLDMMFVRNAFNEHRDIRMLELILDIADYLHVPVVAEGVETREQMVALKAMGCDIVQGYYFSRPVPAADFVRFLEEKRYAEREAGTENSENPAGSDSFSISEAMEIGFDSLYYVDMNTGYYMEFGTRSWHESLKLQRGGSDFFTDLKRDIMQVVFPEDRPMVTEAMEPSVIMGQIQRNGIFTLRYRLMIDGEEKPCLLQAVRSKGSDDPHIIIGVSSAEDMDQDLLGRTLRNVEGDELLSMARDHSEEYESTLTFARIAQALSQDYFAVYYINVVSRRYVEYRMEGAGHRLKVVTTGDDFFSDCAEQIPDRIPEEDRAKVTEAFTETNLMSAINLNKVFSLRYRVLENGVPVHVNVKALRLADDREHILIGMSNIEDQVRKEQQYEEAMKKSLTHARIAQALAADYFSIYYVNVVTDQFLEFSADQAYDELGIEKGGDDFFNLSLENIRRVMYPEDQSWFPDVFTKENILRELDENGSFTLTYRLLFDGVPTYVSMKAMRLEDGDREHIVIGVNNVHNEIKRRQEVVTYASIAEALAADYFSIYYVDTTTDRFIEYSSHAGYEKLNIEKGGDDFFNLSRKNILRVIHPDDHDELLRVFTKENILRELDKNGTFSLDYRLMFDGVPAYVRMKASRMTDLGDPHIVIGVNNVDAQKRREQSMTEQLNSVRRVAERDALTGVKSKHAYALEEERINDCVREDTQEPFAIAVCDVNGLKKVNDTQGHKAGDRYIKDACAIICEIFKHSPVFRIGGDEFVAILRGQDYENRKTLLWNLMARSAGNRRNGGVIVAGGCAAFVPGTDRSLEDVFERADAAMYENKERLKQG